MRAGALKNGTNLQDVLAADDAGLRRVVLAVALANFCYDLVEAAHRRPHRLVLLLPH